MGFEDPNKKGRKRAVAGAEAAKPPAKRPATTAAQGRLSPEQAERVRSNVRALYDSYNALINKARGALDNGAFQALLRAAQGDITSQRLASRLVPRFIALFPDQVEVAAGALIKLHERYQNLDGCEKALEDHTRRDALQGLQAVLLAAASGTPHGSQAVKLILAVLFRLLPQAEAEAPSTEEQEEEEGEVAPADSQAAAAAGPWVRKVLRQALQHHPVTTLTFCFGCLGSSARTSSSSGSGVSPSVVQGVRLWLREHILREPTPSREGTPIDCDGSTSAAAAAAAGGCAASLAAAAAAGAAGIVNGSQAFKGAVASAAAAAAGGGGGAAAAGQQQRGSVLQSVLESSGELRSWVRKEAKGLSRAPEEARAVLQAAMQLMPPERPPAASKRPYPGSQGQQQQQQQRPYGSGSQSPAGGSRSQQQPPQYQQPSPPQQQQQQPGQQHKAPNGVVPRPVNGMERSWSTPSPGRGPRGRAAAGRPPDPAAAGSSGWGQFPRPAGPICRLEPCVLLSNVPWHLKPHDLQQQLQAAEAWVLDSQPPGGAGSSSGAGARACCVLKTPLDAARVYMRHHKSNRLGPQSPPLQVAFASSLPACSRSAAAALAAAGAGGASVHLWVLRAVAGDAEKVTDDLREAGLIPKSVSRVNHPSEPGTVLEAHSAKEAADMLGFLLKTHAAAIAAAAAAAQQQQQQHEELPPLPSDPPPGEWTPVGGSSSRGGKPPSTPAGGPGPGASRLQQQQSAGGEPPPSMQQQQGGQAGFVPGGVRRSNSLPVGVAGAAAAGGGGPGSSHKQGPDGAGGWRQGSWGTPGGGQQQQQWQQGASSGQPGDAPGSRGGWQQSGTPMQQQQQQQQGGRWPPGGQPGSSGGGSSSQGFPPFPGPPGAGPPPSQQQQQRQHNYAGASPSAGPAAGGTPTHAGSPAGGGPGPSLPVGSVPPGGQYNQQQCAGAHVMWRGTLYKSEVAVGTVCCVEAAGGARQTGSAPEPHAWPQALHINHRISVNDALEHYAAAAPHARAVRVLLPQESPAGNVQAIQSFVQYLTSKGRAGMVKLPAANGASPRAVYLIVPRPNVCQSLQVAWDGRCVMLIVVVVPQGAGGAGGGGGGGSSGGGAAKGALPGPPPGGGGGGGGYHHHPGSGMGHRPVR